MASRGSSHMPSKAKQPKVYQIDFTAVASGKRVASTKRRVRWRFGFANPEALAAGQTGTSCRGEEHDVTLVWSLTSGKRLILADGQEVHYSNNRSGSFEFSWTMRGNHVLKLIAHASPPLSPTPGFRQYDFFVDGQSFFTFPKVYRIGLAHSDPRYHQSAPPNPNNPHSHSNGMVLAESGQRTKQRGGSANNIVSIETPHNSVEEEAYLQEAIKNSLEEEKKRNKNRSSSNINMPPKPVGAHVNDPDLLIDFFDDPSASQASQPALPPSTNASFAVQPQAAPLAALPPSTSGFAAPPTWDVPQQQQQFTHPQASVPPVVQVNNGFLSPQAQQVTTPSTLGFGSPAPFQSPVQQAPSAPQGTAGQLVLSPQPSTGYASAAGYAPAANAGYAPPGGNQQFGQPQQNVYQQNQAQEAATAAFANPQATGAPNSGPAAFAQPQNTNQQNQAAGASQAALFSTPQAAGAPPAAPPAAVVQPQNGNQQNQVTEATGSAQPQVANEPTLDQASQAGSINPAPVDNPAIPKVTSISDIFGDNPNADKAYEKFANLDTFDLLKEKKVGKANPFDLAAPTNNDVSLADMKSMNSKTQKSAAMVVSNQQQGNWGGIMNQPSNSSGMGGGFAGQQQQQYGQPPMSSQQGNPFGQYPNMQQNMSSQPAMMQQPQYGKNPAMMQQPQQQQYRQGPPPLQQSQYGQGPPPLQQPQYGQGPPPLQQPQYGLNQYGQQPQQYGAQQGF